MFISKYWRKFIIAGTAFFWASCGDKEAEKSPAEAPEPDKCTDSDTYPLIVKKSGLRCKAELSGSLYTCCDGSSIQGEILGIDECGKTAVIGNVPNGVPGVEINDTLFTNAEAEERTQQIMAAAKKAVNDSLSKKFHNCDSHGGIVDHSDYTANSYNINDEKCEEIALDKARSHAKENSSEIYPSFDRMACVADILGNIFIEVALYGVIYVPPCFKADSKVESNTTANITCEDGTVIDTDDYKKTLETYETKKKECESKSSELIEKINKCLELPLDLPTDPGEE